MTAEDFNDWLSQTGLTVQQASEALDVSKSAVTKYRKEGAPTCIALACSALFHKLTPWKGPDPVAPADRSTCSGGG